MSQPEVRVKYIKMTPISELRPHPKNPNKHPPDQIERLAKLIEYQGWRYTINVSNQSGLINTGHARLMAAQLRGWKEVPVSYQDFEDETQEYASMVADNAIAEWADQSLSQINIDLSDMGPDFDIDLLGIKDFVLEPADKFAPQSDEDHVPDNAETRVKLGDRWILGNHALVCGDSTDVCAVDLLLVGDNVDMVFTDPPYGMNAVSSSGVLSANKKYRGDILNDDSTQVAKDAYALCEGLGIPKMVFWGANYYSSALPDATCWLVWDKNNGQSDQMDCELAWTNFKGVTRQFTQASEKTNRVHPTQKPVSLAEWCLERWEAGSVLDLFGGSGSTLIACEKTSRKCFIMELDPRYCDVILARWEKYTGKTAELQTSGPVEEDPQTES